MQQLQSYTLRIMRISTKMSQYRSRRLLGQCEQYDKIDSWQYVRKLQKIWPLKSILTALQTQTL